MGSFEGSGVFRTDGLIVFVAVGRLEGFGVGSRVIR